MALSTKRARVPQTYDSQSILDAGSDHDGAPATTGAHSMLDILYLGLGLILIGAMGVYAHALTRT